jgi:hypothetical protein
MWDAENRKAFGKKVGVRDCKVFLPYGLSSTKLCVNHRALKQQIGENNLLVFLSYQKGQTNNDV